VGQPGQPGQKQLEDNETVPLMVPILTNIEIQLSQYDILAAVFHVSAVQTTQIAMLEAELETRKGEEEGGDGSGDGGRGIVVIPTEVRTVVGVLGKVLSGLGKNRMEGNCSIAGNAGRLYSYIPVILSH
jgi:hypothetical protein